MRPILLALALLTAACGFALAANAQASHDGEILGAGQAGKLITTAGTWTFSNQEGADGYFVLLNGKKIANGSAIELLVDDDGQLYAHGKSGLFFLWSGLGWLRTGRFDPVRTDCATAVVVGLEWRPETFARTYKILRDGTQLAVTGLNSYSDQTVQASTTYTYEVAAVDARGRTISVRTLDVTTAAASPLGDPAVCPSSYFSGMTWDWSTGANQQNGFLTIQTMKPSPGSMLMETLRG